MPKYSRPASTVTRDHVLSAGSPASVRANARGASMAFRREAAICDLWLIEPKSSE